MSSSYNPFEILDNIGSPRVFDIHMKQNIIAYESDKWDKAFICILNCNLLFIFINKQGNGILLWDLEVDKKIKLHNHDSQVQAVFFGGSQDDKYVFSIDGQFQVNIFISEWDMLRRVVEMSIPHKNRKKPVKSVLANYDKRNNIILVVENEDLGGIRLSVWEFKNEKLILQFINDIDNSSTALFLDCLNISDHSLQYTQIAIAEQQCIKYYQIQSNSQVVLTNRVHLKENVINMCVNPTQNIVIVLLHTGKVILIDSQGELISQIKNTSIIFSSISSVENIIFCGGNNGSVCVYDISTCKILKEIPYDQSIRKSSYINIKDQVEIQVTSQQEIKTFGSSFDYKVRNKAQEKKNYGPAICSLKNSQDGHLLVVVFSDGNTIVMEIKSQTILHKLVAHTCKINQILWDKQNKNKFYAVGDDGFLSFWDLNGDRWQSKMIDLSQAIDNTINSFTKTNQQILSEYHLKEKQNEGETTNNTSMKLQIKSISLNTYKDEIYCADNKGNLYIFDSINGKFINKFNLSGFQICSISLSPGCKYIGILFITGLTMIFDCSNKFTLQVKLEDVKDKQINSIEPGKLNQNGYKNNKFQINKGIILIEDSISAKQRNKDSISLVPMNNNDKSFNSIISGNNYKSKQTLNSNKNDSYFLAITLHSKNNLRLHSVQQISPSQLSSVVITNFSVEGLIQSFVCHPSNQYVLILSNVGYVYIYNLKSSELRGKVDIPKYSQRITIDPSGLYFAISAYNSYNQENQSYHNFNAFNNTQNSIMKTDKSTLTVYNPQREVDLFFKRKPDISNNFKSKKPIRVILYEIGTGNMVGEISSLFNIESLSISEDGQFISIGSQTGIISIWSTCQEVRENIFEVLSQMRIKDDFWRDFPIYLDEKENIIEDDYNDEYYQRKDDKSENLNLSSKSMLIEDNYFQKQSIIKTGRSSNKEKEKSNLKSHNQRQLHIPIQSLNQQRSNTMNFIDTQNRLQLSSVFGTLDNIQGQNVQDKNNIELENFDRFYRSKNDLSIFDRKIDTPQRYNQDNVQQQSNQGQRSNLIKYQYFPSKGSSQFKQKDTLPKINSQEDRSPNYLNQQYLNQQQVNNKSQQRNTQGNSSPSQFRNQKLNTQERSSEPKDIDDDVMSNFDNKYNRQQSAGNMNWRNQQQHQKQTQDEKFKNILYKNIKNNQEFDNPLPSSIRQSERSNNQYDQIEKYQSRIKDNKLQQIHLFQYQK